MRFRSLSQSWPGCCGAARIRRGRRPETVGDPCHTCGSGRDGRSQARSQDQNGGRRL